MSNVDHSSDPELAIEMAIEVGWEAQTAEDAVWCTVLRLDKFSDIPLIS